MIFPVHQRLLKYCDKYECISFFHHLQIKSNETDFLYPYPVISPSMALNCDTSLILPGYAS